MNLDGSYFPYPFLSSYTDDYGQIKFEMNYERRVDNQGYIFDIDINLEDEALQNLIDKKQAKYLIIYECKSLGLKRTIESHTDKFNFKILMDDVSRRVDIFLFLVADTNIKLSSKNFHKDYLGMTFNLEKGNILGSVDKIWFNPLDDSEDIKDVGSILKIDKNPEDEVGPISVNLDSENIIILLSSNDYKNYLKLRNNGNNSLLISMIVTPTIINVLNVMQRGVVESDESYYQDRKWYRVIVRKVLSLDYSENPADWENLFEITQRIIDNQISLAMSDMTESLNIEEDIE